MADTNTPGRGLSILTGKTWTWVSTPAGKTSGIAALTWWAKSVGLPWAPSVAIAALSNIVSASVQRTVVEGVSFMWVVDRTHSTSRIIGEFVAQVAWVVNKRRDGIGMTFTPVIFDGSGTGKAGKTGDVNFYASQPYVAGPTHVSKWIEASLAGLSPNKANVVLVITDDPVHQDPNYKSDTLRRNVAILQENDALLVIMIDNSANQYPFDQCVEGYREAYKDMEDNLIIISGAQDPNAIIDLFIESKVAAKKTGGKVDVRSMLPMLRWAAGTGTLQIATGTGKGGILSIDHQK